MFLLVMSCLVNSMLNELFLLGSGVLWIWLTLMLFGMILIVFLFWLVLVRWLVFLWICGVFMLFELFFSSCYLYDYCWSVVFICFLWGWGICSCMLWVYLSVGGCWGMFVYCSYEDEYIDLSCFWCFFVWLCSCCSLVGWFLIGDVWCMIWESCGL